VLIPISLASLFGIALNPVSVYLAQLDGASLVALGIINWFYRDATNLHGLLFGQFVANAIGFLVTFFGQLSGAIGINVLGWFIVVIYLFLAVGHGYYRFIARSALHSVIR
jgi:hypothetical protein